MVNMYPSINKVIVLYCIVLYSYADELTLVKHVFIIINIIIIITRILFVASFFALIHTIVLVLSGVKTFE
jgi:hypothetical protein